MSEEKINAYCAICGKGYRMCNSCADYIRINPWKVVTDTLEHYKVYLALHEYDLSKDKVVAKEQLENCDLSEMESFLPHIKNVIDEILSEKTIVAEDSDLVAQENDFVDEVTDE